MPVENFPSGLTALIERGWVRSFPALDIVFADGTGLHLSSVPISVDGTDYDPRLSEVKSIRASRSRSVDFAELTIDNIDLQIGDTLFDDANEDLLENLPATLSQIYVNVRDAAEKYKIPRLSGVLHSFVEDGASDLNVTLISEDYAGGSVAPYNVKPSCVWQYKDGIYCTYTGSLPTCDLSFDGANGCVVHFGMDMAKARYGGGALDLPESVVTQFTPFTGGGGGIGGGGCFAGSTPIYVSDDLTESAPIKYFSEVGSRILGVDRNTLIPQADAVRGDLHVVEAREWYQLVFSDGSELNVTETHPFFPEGGKRIIVRDMEVGMAFRRMPSSGRWRTVKLVSKIFRTSPFPMRFYNVPVRDTQAYWANGFPVSNNKGPYRDDFPYPSDQRMFNPIQY